MPLRLGQEGARLLCWQLSCSLNQAKPLQNSCHLVSPYPHDRQRPCREGRAVVAELGLGFKGLGRGEIPWER